ncbi:hypothetical protein D3C73_1182850 [compost metagenome]
MGQAQLLLLPDAEIPLRALQVRSGGALGRAAGQDSGGNPARLRSYRDRVPLHERSRRCGGAQASVRGNTAQHGAPLPGNRVQLGAGRALQVHRQQVLHQLRWQPAAGRGAPRLRGQPQPAGHRRAVHRRCARLLRGAEPERPARPDRREDPQGDSRAARLPGERRPQLPEPVSQRRDPLRRRGAADPAGEPDRRRSGGGHVCAG